MDKNNKPHTDLVSHLKDIYSRDIFPTNVPKKDNFEILINRYSDNLERHFNEQLINDICNIVMYHFKQWLTVYVANSDQRKRINYITYSVIFTIINKMENCPEE
jgi:hypothetical protein